MKRYFLLIFTAAMLTPLTSATAAPSNTVVTAVYECRPGSCARKLSSGSLARGTLRIEVTSDAAFGLSTIRIEAIGPGDPDWSCIKQVSAGGSQHYRSSFDWFSSRWPFPGPGSGCTEDQPHKHGEATLNGSYSLRVIATESGSGAKQTSAAFQVRLDNPPQSPLWRGEPSVEGTSVILRWYRNPEPDVIEYRLVRTDAAERKKTVAVDAAASARTTGCEPEKEATFTCTDTPPGGRVRYVVQVFRKSPGSHPICKTHPEPCIGSLSSARQTVSTTSGNGAKTPATIGGVSSPTPTTASSTVATPRVHPSPTSSSSERPAAAPPTTGSSRGGPTAGAAAALAALIVAHALRLRRTRRFS